MDSATKQLKKAESEKRREIIRNFKAAKKQFIADVVEGRRPAELFTKRIWPISPNPYPPFPFFIKQTLIDVKPLKRYSGLYFTTRGWLVVEPGNYSWAWTLWPLRFSNDEYLEMIEVFKNEQPKPKSRSRAIFARH